MPGSIGSILQFPEQLSYEVIGEDDQSTANGYLTSTLGNGTPVCGISFTAPPSGIVKITVGANAEVTSGSGIIRVGWRIRSGDTIGSGAVTDGSEPGDGTHQGGPFRCETRSLLAGPATPARVAGLTPGAEYNLALYHYITGGAGGIVYSRSGLLECEL